jgi:hypothetical protein
MPSSTPTMERFIATHMICDRMAPDARGLHSFTLELNLSDSRTSP